MKGATLTFAFVLLIFPAVLGSSLTILYTNDLHSRLSRVASLGELIDQERRGEGSTLLLDAGDCWHDFRLPVNAVWGAWEMTKWMNSVSYDAMALGNHELYWGADELARLCGAAEFPVLCSNLIAKRDIDPPFLPSTVVTVGDLQVLIVGLVTAELLPYPDYPWLDLVPAERALQKILEQRGQDADLAIALSHLSIERASMIATAVDGIDVFLTGHSHETTPKPLVVNDSLIVQAGAFGEKLGKLQLEIDPETGRISEAENVLLETERAPVCLNRGYLELLKVALCAAIFVVLML